MCAVACILMSSVVMTCSVMYILCVCWL